MSALGKRKIRDEPDAEGSHGSTLFVSNLPYNVTSVDLQTLFSDIAPVRSAFVVQEQGTGVSKGVGYVAFAIREDAETAFDQISKEGIAINGRNLRVNWAAKKQEKGTKDSSVKLEKTETRKPHPKTASAAGPKDPLAIRTVIISGLPSGIDSKTLWKKVRKSEGAENVDWPFKSADGVEDPSTAHVLFATPANAQEAVSKLHAHVFKGSLLSVTLKKRLDHVAKAPRPTANATAKTSGPTPSRASRLIVRNLPFDITEQDLRALFLPYGPVYSITIPQKVEEKDGDGDGDVKMEDGVVPATRGKGFAFVWMWSKKEAEKAMEECNGKKVRAGFAANLVQDKQKKKKERREEKKKMKADEAGDAEENEEEEGEDAPVTTKSTERVIAVDWALSKERWEEEKKKAEEEESSDFEEGSDDSEGEESDEEALGVHEGSDEEEEGSDATDDRSDDGEEPTKPQLPPPETGTTLFIRNIPFSATDDELRTLFRAFGPLRYARITMDQEMGRSRGTGFVCFWNLTDADKAVEQSDILRAEMGGQSDMPKKNPFAMPSLLTPDPSALSAQSLVLHGRTLDVVRAVTRDEAGKLKEAGEKAREKADKRNMYLLREGVILPNTLAAETVNAQELEKRTNSFNARRTLLRSNPALYVSKTRLSIRQIPLFVSERMLKRLAIHAMRTFGSEVKAKQRQDLTEDEKTMPTEPEGDGQEKEKDKSTDKAGKGKTKLGRNTGVKQAKIVRQQDRVDSVTGKGRSRGYGFLELHTHADALRVLRWANNNPAVGALFEEWRKAELEDLIKEERKNKSDDSAARIKRMSDELESWGKKTKGVLIVEFSIENVQVVQRRAAHQRDGKSVSNPGEKKPREKLTLPQAEEQDEALSPKKQRVSKDSAKEKSPRVKSESVKPFDKVKSLIGRKRKERKAKKA